MNYTKIVALAIATVLATGINAEIKSSGDKLIAFKKLEKGHKDDWFNHMKQVHNQKYDLLKKIHGDWVSFGTQYIQHDMAMTDCSPAAKDAQYADHLRKAIDLHVKHNEMWKKMCMDNHTKALEIQARHEQDLAPYIAYAHPDIVTIK